VIGARLSDSCTTDCIKSLTCCVTSVHGDCSPASCDFNVLLNNESSLYHKQVSKHIGQISKPQHKHKSEGLQSVLLVALKIAQCIRYKFLPRDAMLSVVYAIIVCLCVCLSVCHTQVLESRHNGTNVHSFTSPLVHQGHLRS